MIPEQRAAVLCLMVFDVDGVMTDGRLYYAEGDQEYKAFHTLDGKGLKMLQEAGLTLAIITGRRSGIVRRRAEELGITYLFEGVEDKRACLFALLEDLRLPASAAGYMGDDLIDLPAMLACGFSAAPANAHPLVRAQAGHVSAAKGGEGAVREICDFILAAQGKLDAAQAPYLLP
jgi:3-deoxy-D-manno-octulosonate 8-phosphate phosphatase (KDO 8-P phosphatase)